MFSSNTSQVVETATAAEAVDFSNDYLSRSDLVGNTNGKTFTFSAWIWFDGTNTDYVYYADGNASSYFQVSIAGNGALVVEGTSTTGSVVLSGSYNFSTLNNFIRTFYHVLISVDLTDTAKRSIYVNDLAVSVSWGNYTNTNIAFMQPTHTVAGATASANYRGRLSNVFLDYTYRDLSITANRRLFVTADLKPAAGQAALNPILYLPMSDPTTVGTNAGTGGNFTLTGTIARSGRGPNQYNAPYSTLTTGTYLSRTTVPTGMTDGKQFTLSFCMMLDSVSEEYAVAFGSNLTSRFLVQAAGNLGQQLTVSGWNSAGTNILSVSVDRSTNKLVVGRNYVVNISIDMSDTAKRHVYINGEAQTVGIITYTDDSIDFNIATTPVYRIGRNLSTTQFDGKLGAVWFNTSYIDLSVASNLAKFVSGTGIDAKPVDLGATGELPTGTSPILYFPMYGNNAGKNYGTGGDFTVNSGPYTGARGPNEFWGNKATFNGTTGRLTKSAALTGVSAGKIFSASYFVTFAASATNQSMMHIANSGSSRLSIFRNTSNQLTLSGRNTSNTEILAATVTSPTIAASSYSIQIVVDLANSANRAIYINGTAATVTWSTYTNGDIALASNTVNLGVADTGSYIYYLNGSLSEFYFTTEYIDFTQEANRLKFRDCFGNPTDLPSAITALSVPNPAIYMRFPPTSFGTNSGTGGDFTVNGTITDGGQL